MLTLAGALALASAPTCAAGWVLVDIGALVGGSTSATAINNNGQVVGIQQGIGYGHPTHAFLYDNGTVTDLGSLGGVYTYPYGINNTAQIVGQSATVDDIRHAFLYENGQMTDLGTFGGSSSYAVAINSAGQIAINVDGQALFYDHGVAVSLGTLGGAYTTARAINDAGQIAGYSQTNLPRPDAPGNLRMDAFIFSDGKMSDVGTAIGGNSNYGYAVNNSGQIAGWINAKGAQQAFLYSAGKVTNPVKGATGVAYDVNEQGQVVGYSSIGGFLYSGGKVTHLDTLPEVVAAGWSSVNPLRINNLGQIVGVAYINTGSHAFLMTPAQ